STPDGAEPRYQTGITEERPLWVRMKTGGGLEAGEWHGPLATPGLSRSCHLPSSAPFREQFFDCACVGGRGRVINKVHPRATPREPDRRGYRRARAAPNEREAPPRHIAPARRGA